MRNKRHESKGIQSQLYNFRKTDTTTSCHKSPVTVLELVHTRLMTNRRVELEQFVNAAQ
jgi:hypothetical protein